MQAAATMGKTQAVEIGLMLCLGAQQAAVLG
jgi:hypothetical protein